MKEDFRPDHWHQDKEVVKGPKSEMCDRHEKEYKHKKTPKSKSQHVMQHHLNQGHRHHRGHNSTNPAEDTNDIQPNQQNQHDNNKTHHPHHGQHKKNHHRVSVLESTNGSTSSPSSSSLSSSSSSSSLTTSSSSSSFSTSSTSSPSSSLSSESSSEFSDRYHNRRPRHSQSFSDVSGKHKYFEEDDDTAPLINARGNINRSSAKQKRDIGKSSSSCPAKEGLKNKQTSISQQGNNGSVRKAKSMEDLPTPKDRGGNGKGDGSDQENSKSEAKNNFLKEKMKFSAFLNEITRQVLSPMRLTSLGVRDAHSPGRVSPRSRETDSSTDKPKRQRSRSASPDSVCSSKHSHSSRRSHSSRLSYSKSFHHFGHRTSLSPAHIKHRPRNSHSWSPTPEHQSHLPSRKKCHIHQHEDCSNPRQLHHHGYHHATSNHHHHGHPHSPQHQDHHSPTYYNTSRSHEEKPHKDHYSPAHHHDEHRGGGQCHDHHAPSHDHHSESHQDHAQTHKDNYDPSCPCGDHHIKPHHHGDHHSSGHHHHNNPNSMPTTPCRHGHHSPTGNQEDHLTHEHGDHHREPHRHHHGIHKAGPPHLYHQDHRHGQGRHPPHSDQSTEAMHQCGDHRKTHYLHHRHHHSPSNPHHSQQRHSKSQNDLQDHHSPGHPFLHGDHRRECFGHYNENLHRETHHHHRGNHHHEAYRHHHGDHHYEAHHHHHGDHPSTGHHYHHGDQHSWSHHYHHGNQHSETPHRCCGDQCSPGHYYHHGAQQSEVHHHHHGDQHSPGFHHHHWDQQGDKPCHKHLCGDYKTSHHPESHLSHDKHNSHENNRLDDKHTPLTSTISLPSHKTPVSKDSPSNTNSPSSQDEDQTAFTGPPSQEKKTQEPGTVVILQDQNEGLHQSLLKTAVRMECLGEEFISSQKVLETELLRTRMELSNLMDRFKRLQDDCSSTQHTNTLLEQKLHLMLQNMEGERERLNWRISELTEQLTDVKIANTMEEINQMTSVPHLLNLPSQADDALTQAVPPIAPPPAQFMDNHSYEKEKSPGQEQALGSVPEEEESDWSEMGEETPRLILTGANRGQTWRHQEADMDKDSESGSEEIFRRHSPYPLQIPHLQFTIHNEFLPPAHTSSCPSGFKNLSDTACQNLKSAILIRSASLEEIPLTRQHVHKELRGTEAVMNLHHSADEAAEDLDNEILHHWRMSNDRDTVIRRPTRNRRDEVDGSVAGLQSAEQLLKHLMCDSSEGAEPGRAEVHVWTGGISDEVLNVERTQL